MRGDLLDVVLLVAAAGFGVSGYRRGFAAGALSLVGLLGGGALGARCAPALARAGPPSDLDETLVGVTVVLVGALAGWLFAGLAARRLRDRVTWRPARLLDALTGGLLGVAGLLLVAWLLGTAVASAPYPALASQVRRSMVISAVDAVLPDAPRRFSAGFRRLVDGRGPEIISALQPTRPREVPAPDPALASSRAVTSSRPHVLKVTGTATACSRRVEGTGFVYARERVLTNAHVVAGVRDPVVQAGDGRRRPARVVLFDPGRDVAVLHVPGLSNVPLAFGGRAEPGDDALVVGYPQDGPFRADAARVRQAQRVRGLDIYGDRTVVREVYALRALVQPGNSGGPLLDAEGRVLGVVFAAAADRPDTGYALTAREVSSDAAAGRTATRPVSTRGCG